MKEITFEICSLLEDNTKYILRNNVLGFGTVSAICKIESSGGLYSTRKNKADNVLSYT
jgi:hypothetical protein